MPIANQTINAKPLHDNGKRQAQRMGLWLAQQQYIPDSSLCAASQRAIISAEKCLKAMGITTQELYTRKALYHAPPQALLHILQGMHDASHCLLLVSDRKSLEQLLKYLTINDQQPAIAEDKRLHHGSVAVLSLDQNWHNLTAANVTLRHLTHAASLPALFPFPDCHGSELRQRPAYYYRQSSVIPYRIANQQELELLLIRSSKQHHWVVPKGIHEPGLSAQQSAAKEAYEEAGVEGLVTESPLGYYHYQKWGSQCDVIVYGMQVERVIEENKWEESHRGRRWCSLVEAKSLLKEQSLLPMLTQLAAQLQAQSEPPHEL
ncbi:MAG: NUDIX domain-containing protein [Mariprofundus sp.]|nr:NUDIX domain-containing protein [Mariprofundus sp.]